MSELNGKVIVCVESSEVAAHRTPLSLPYAAHSPHPAELALVERHGGASWGAGASGAGQETRDYA